MTSQGKPTGYDETHCIYNTKAEPRLQTQITFLHAPPQCASGDDVPESPIITIYSFSYNTS